MSWESAAQDDGGWAAEARRLLARVRVLEDALRPFAKFGCPADKFPPDAPMAMLDKVKMSAFDRAYEVLGDATFLGVDDIIRQENRHVDP